MLRGRHSVPRLGIALLVSLVVLGACGGGGGNKNKASEGGSTNGKKTAVLGFVGALTGDSANLGVNIRDGAKVAIDEWNKKGGPITYKGEVNLKVPSLTVVLKICRALNTVPAEMLEPFGAAVLRGLWKG